MKLTTNGIGVDRLSLTKAGLFVYCNEKFEQWANPRTLRLKKISTAGENQVFCFALGDGALVTTRKGARAWFRSWSNQQKKPPVSHFGATDPLAVRLTDLNELEIVMPPASRCAKERRPNGNHKHRAKEAAIEANRYVLPAAPELPLEDPVTEVTNEPDIDPVLRDTTDYGPKPTPTDPVQHMRDAVAIINAYKGVKGSAVVLTVTDSGRLRVFEAHD